jgi:hypothetical protein
MATLYLLADEPVKNQQQQDCHLVAIIYAPDGSDSGALRKEAENKIKEEVDKQFALGERFGLRFTDKNTASEYLRADPGHAKGSLNLPSTVPVDLAHSADSLIWRTGPRAIVVPMVSGATCPPKESSLRP